MGDALLVIDVTDPLYTGELHPLGNLDYNDFVAGGDSQFAWNLPADQWEAISLNDTSGTTGKPKGVVYHHRGEAIYAMSNIREWDLPKHAVYLWTLPMFHCNGWCFAWTVVAQPSANVRLRRVEAQATFEAIRSHHVTHFYAAPIVHSLLVNAPVEMQEGLPSGVKAMVVGAAPPAAMIEGMERLGIELTHVHLCGGDPSHACVRYPREAMEQVPFSADSDLRESSSPFRRRA